MKTINAKKVLQLMDNDYSYQEAIKIVIKETNISKPQLEKELELFI